MAAEVALEENEHDPLLAAEEEDEFDTNVLLSAQIILWIRVCFDGEPYWLFLLSAFGVGKADITEIEFSVFCTILCGFYSVVESFGSFLVIVSTFNHFNAYPVVSIIFRDYFFVLVILFTIPMSYIVSFVFADILIANGADVFVIIFLVLALLKSFFHTTAQLRSGKTAGRFEAAFRIFTQISIGSHAYCYPPFMTRLSDPFHILLATISVIIVLLFSHRYLVLNCLYFLWKIFLWILVYLTLCMLSITLGYLFY